MKKKRKVRKSDKAEVPMSAMIDIVFLLLVYFVMTYKPQLIEAHMAINLPSADPGTPPEVPPPPPLEVLVLPNEQYMLGSKAVTLDSLEEALIGMSIYNPDLTVIIKVSKDAREEQLINLLDRCARAKLTNLNVLTIK